jgi:hypothetical protein
MFEWGKGYGRGEVGLIRHLGIDATRNDRSPGVSVPSQAARIINGACIGVFGRALVVFMVAAVAPSTALSAGDANRVSCPAETESSPGFRSYMPDGRAYELVTPPYKEGAALASEPGAVSADGSHLILGAAGVFGGAHNYWFEATQDPYEFARGGTGWQSTTLAPAAGEYIYSAFLAVSTTNLGKTLWGAQHTGLRFHEDIYLRSGPGPSEFLRVGPGTPRGESGSQVLESDEIAGDEELNLVGASHDLTHSLYEIVSARGGGEANLWDGDTTEPEQESLYEYVYTGVEDHEPVLVGVRNRGPLDGIPHIDEHAELISQCGIELGGGIALDAAAGSTYSSYNAVSANGEAVFFTALACAGGPATNELYARIDGESTVALSEPALPGGAAGECSPSEPCHGTVPKPAIFEGASEDGSCVFFLSEQPLVNGAPAEGMKLYEERLNVTTAQVEQVVDVSNVGIAGLDPEVQGVVRVAEDGQRVYFVAKAALTGADRVVGREPEEENPVAGADNLYVYEPDPAHSGEYRTVFVATLLTSEQEAALQGEEAAELAGIETQANRTFMVEESEVIRQLEAGEFGSGQVAIEKAFLLINEAYERQRQFIRRTTGSRGPSGTVFEDKNVWRPVDTRPVQATPDGAFLVFPSSARLTPQDSSGVPQLFEYSAAGESLTRVSIGASGPASGNVATFQDSPQIPTQSFVESRPTAAQTGRAITADGSRVFFTSAGGLVPQAKEGATSVYEYSEGQVYLVSGGTDASTTKEDGPTVRLLGIDPSAQNVLFVTASPLVAQQGDTEPGVYDAREEGGFPAPVLEPGCLGETCRGASGIAPASPLPGSASQPGGGNLPGGRELNPPAVKKVVNKTAKCKRGFVKNKKHKCVRKKKKTKARKASNKGRA